MKILLEDLDYLITMDAKRRILRDASIVIDGDVIEDLGSSEEIKKRYLKAEFDEVIQGRHRLAMPGLINAHQHVSEHLSRGLIPDNLRTIEWVMGWAKPFYSSVSDEDEYWSTLFACLDMIKHGTTCFIDQGVYNDGIRSKDAMEEIGMRGIVGRHAADRPPERLPQGWREEWLEKQFFPSAEKALASLERVIQLFPNPREGRVRPWVCLEGKRMHTSDELYVGAKKLADKYGVGLNYHLSSSIEEAELTKRETGKWPIEHAEELGALGRNVLLAHATIVQPHEVEILRKTQTSVAFCPGTALKLGKGASKVGLYPEMLERGVNVALGCDGPSAAGSTDLVRQLYLVAGLFKDGRMDPLQVPAEKALEMATINGAKALLWENEIGSLEVGKKADIILFDTKRAEWLPLFDPIQNLVYSASGESVDTVIIDGKIVMEGRRMRTVDEEEILAKAQELAREIGIRSGLLKT